MNKCDCFPHGPDEPCTCNGCWACIGHVTGCTCDINWDCEHSQEIIRWLESPEGEEWSREAHHLHKWREDDNWSVPRLLVSIKDDEMPCDTIGGLLIA